MSIQAITGSMPAVQAVTGAMPVIASLVVLEGLLSVDNAMVIAAMTNHLPGKQKIAAWRIGLVGAYGFRIILLAFATFLMTNRWIKAIGAFYLIHLMCKNLGTSKEDGGADHSRQGSFWSTVVAVSFADLCFSLDNVLASAALSPKLWVVIAGVGIGIAMMGLVAGLFVSLMEKYPVLTQAAYVIIGYIGFLLISSEFLGLHMSEVGKFVGVAAIIASSLIYSHSSSLRQMSTPVIAELRGFMGDVAYMIDSLIKPVFQLAHATVSVR